MAGRLLTSVTLLLSALGVTAAPAPQKGSDFWIGVPISNPDITNAIPHKYIVVYNNTFDDDVVAAHESKISSIIAKRNLGKRGEISGKLLSTSVHTFNVKGWRAMALEADDLMINDIFAAEEVEYIEQDAYINLNTKLMQTVSTSGLARISHAQPGEDNYVFDDSAGEGITAYIVDTGIRTTHEEFGGRATWGANFVNDVVSSAVFHLLFRVEASIANTSCLGYG